MDAIHSWIDEEEVSRLAKTLSTTPERMKEWKKMESDGFAIPEKQGEDNEVENTAEQIPEKSLNQQRSLLAGASQMAKSAGLTHSEKKPAILEKMKTQATEGAEGAATGAVAKAKLVTPEPQTASAVNQSQSSEPIGTFVMVQELFSKEVKDDGLCIIDRDGDVLYNSFKNLGLTDFTAKVMKTSSLMKIEGEEVGSLRLRHSATEVIEFLSVNSTRGVVLVAARLSEGLSVAQRQKMAEALRQVLNAK